MSDLTLDFDEWLSYGIESGFCSPTSLRDSCWHPIGR